MRTGRDDSYWAMHAFWCGVSQSRDVRRTRQPAELSSSPVSASSRTGLENASLHVPQHPNALGPTVILMKQFMVPPKKRLRDRIPVLLRRIPKGKENQSTASETAFQASLPSALTAADEGGHAPASGPGEANPQLVLLSQQPQQRRTLNSDSLS